MSRIRRYLTYSNVTSTLCLFLVLGGGTALALHRNEVKSRNIAPGAVRLSDTNDKLRLNCPGGTRYHEGACIEASHRPTTNDWNEAAADCTDEGRRLPTVAELASFRFEPGITLINQEWAIERDTSTAQGANGWTVNGAGAPSPSFLSNDLSYRCVARPKR